MQQNITGCRCLIHEILRNAEAETMECYKMIYKLILAPTFHNIVLHSVTFYLLNIYICHIAVISITI